MLVLLSILACNGPSSDDSAGSIDTSDPLNAPADADDDGFDERDDCDDDDPNVYPGAPVVLADGIDQDCDGVDELPIEVLSYQGAATVDSDSDTYTGSTTLLDYPKLEAETELCRMEWPVASSTPSATACNGCTWAYDLTHGAVTTRTGDYCDRWYTEESWDTGPTDFTIALHPAWTGGDGSETAREALLFLVSPVDADPYWYAAPPDEMTLDWDAETGEVSWSFVAGEYFYYPG